MLRATICSPGAGSQPGTSRSRGFPAHPDLTEVKLAIGENHARSSGATLANRFTLEEIPLAEYAVFAPDCPAACE